MNDNGDDPDVIGTVTDLRASREPLTPEEVELHELRESVRGACAKGQAHVDAILQALGQATDASVLLVKKVDLTNVEQTTKLREFLSVALGCGVILFPPNVVDVMERAVEVARAELRARRDVKAD